MGSARARGVLGAVRSALGALTPGPAAGACGSAVQGTRRAASLGRAKGQAWCVCVCVCLQRAPGRGVKKGPRESVPSAGSALGRGASSSAWQRPAPRPAPPRALAAPIATTTHRRRRRTARTTPRRRRRLWAVGLRRRSVRLRVARLLRRLRHRRERSAFPPRRRPALSPAPPPAPRRQACDSAGGLAPRGLPSRWWFASVSDRSTRETRRCPAKILPFKGLAVKGIRFFLDAKGTSSRQLITLDFGGVQLARVRRVKALFRCLVVPHLPTGRTSTASAEVRKRRKGVWRVFVYLFYRRRVGRVVGVLRHMTIFLVCPKDFLQVQPAHCWRERVRPLGASQRPPAGPSPFGESGGFLDRLVCLGGAHFPLPLLSTPL